MVNILSGFVNFSQGKAYYDLINLKKHMEILMGLLYNILRFLQIYKSITSKFRQDYGEINARLCLMRR